MSAIQELINKFSPIVYIHSNERYFPASIDWLLNYSTLVDFNKKTKIVKPTQRDLYESAKSYNFARVADGDVVLSFPPETFKGQQPLSDVPCYALYKEMNDKIYITYIFIFPFNGNYEIAGLVGLGSHPGDMEHMTVECSKSGVIERIFYAAHGYKDGRWVPAQDVEFENGHPVCFMAVSGHGLYPKAGQAFRFGGFANDYMDRGFRWAPKVDLLLDKDDPNFNIDKMGWSVFNGRFGGDADKPNTEGITSLPDKPWYSAVDNVNEENYKPPKIIDEKYTKKINILSRVKTFAIIYTVIMIISFLVKKIIFKGDKQGTGQALMRHLSVILITTVLYYMYMSGGKKLLLKYVPV